MLVTAPASHFALPANFEFIDVVSVNFRHCFLYMRVSHAENQAGRVTTARFPWTESTREENRQNRYNSLPAKGMVLMELLDEALTDDNCQIILMEADKEFCSVSFVAPVPQTVYRGLQNIHCPVGVAIPHIENTEISAKDYIVARLATLTPVD